MDIDYGDQYLSQEERDEKQALEWLQNLPKWKQKNGNYTDIRLMTEQHLKNTISMIERKESEFYTPVIRKMQNELSRRKVAEMNIYQKALNEAVSAGIDEESYNSLKEIVDRATPTKAKASDSRPRFRCPNCGEGVVDWESDTMYDYCPECGQRLDWSEERLRCWNCGRELKYGGTSFDAWDSLDTSPDRNPRHITGLQPICDTCAIELLEKMRRQGNE